MTVCPAELSGELPKCKDVAVLQNPIAAALKAPEAFVAEALARRCSQPCYVIFIYLSFLLCFCTSVGTFERLEVASQLRALQKHFGAVTVVFYMSSQHYNQDKINRDRLTENRLIKTYPTGRLTSLAIETLAMTEDNERTSLTTPAKSTRMVRSVVKLAGTVN
jgi:hypothetical protein